MAHRVRRYSGDHTVLVPCSICGSQYEYPGEIRMRSDKLWYCYIDDKGTLKVDEDRAVAASRRRREPSSPWRGGS